MATCRLETHDVCKACAGLQRPNAAAGNPAGGTRGHGFIKIADICHAERGRTRCLFVGISPIKSYRWNLIQYLCNKPLWSIIALDCH